MILGRKNIFHHPSNVKSKTGLEEKLRIMGNFLPVHRILVSMAFEGCYELQGFNDLMELSMAIKSEQSWGGGGKGITSVLLMEIFIGIMLFPMVGENGIN